MAVMNRFPGCAVRTKTTRKRGVRAAPPEKGGEGGPSAGRRPGSRIGGFTDRLVVRRPIPGE